MRTLLSTIFVSFSFFGFNQVCLDCQGLYNNKQYEKVIEKIATSTDSLHVEDLVLLAKSYQSIGMKKDAIGAYSHILLNDEDNLDALVAVGALFIEMEQYENALFVIDKALGLDAKNQNAIYNKAVYYYYKNNDAEFNAYLDKALNSNPKDMDLYFVKAMKDIENLDFKSAIANLKIIESTNNNYPNLNFYLGYALYKSNQLEEAKSKFKRSIELKDEQVIDAYYYLAQIYKSEDKKVEACDAYTNAINLGDITITKEADDYCIEKKKSKIKLFDRGFRPSF
ncbi:MAG: tetratricopeptide repeat protein [Flavobacteriia bacterium]|jgi:tetratricopeptide (TPR) repeat protein